MRLAADKRVQQRDSCLDQHAGLQQDHVLHVLAEGARQGLVGTHTPDARQQPELRPVVQRHNHQHVGTLAAAARNTTATSANRATDQVC